MNYTSMPPFECESGLHLPEAPFSLGINTFVMKEEVDSKTKTSPEGFVAGRFETVTF